MGMPPCSAVTSRGNSGETASLADMVDSYGEPFCDPVGRDDPGDFARSAGPPPLRSWTSSSNAGTQSLRRRAVRARRPRRSKRRVGPMVPGPCRTCASSARTLFSVVDRRYHGGPQLGSTTRRSGRWRASPSAGAGNSDLVCTDADRAAGFDTDWAGSSSRAPRSCRPSRRRKRGDQAVARQRCLRR